ncbi:hypothetical protein Taro_030813 [Colocasia esculenta]|uniref:Uncharacterized protein n=1 Tax=Colocasia esculenta TaxID=4460 RepID=A0A843VMC2_COLES|nr:hypothetical protein [Colocasia esculenta]
MPFLIGGRIHAARRWNTWARCGVGRWARATFHRQYQPCVAGFPFLLRPRPLSELSSLALLYCMVPAESKSLGLFGGAAHLIVRGKELWWPVVRSGHLCEVDHKKSFCLAGKPFEELLCEPGEDQIL